MLLMQEMGELFCMSRTGLEYCRKNPENLMHSKCLETKHAIISLNENHEKNIYPVCISVHRNVAKL